MSHPPPIFIAGCGRSGTTYLQTIIDTHREVFVPTETLFLPEYLRRAHHVPRRLLEWLFFNEPHLTAWYDGPRFPVNDAAEAIERVHQHMAAKEGARVWGQKTPRFVRHIDLFRRHFPGCRWVLIYRDPRATVASMLNSPVHPFSLGWACARWVRDNQPVLDHLRHPRPDTLVVCYEELIRDFDNHLTRIFDFLGLERLGREVVERGGVVRNFKGTTFSIQKNNVRDGLAPQLKSIDSWRKTLSEGQVREIERRCDGMMQALGYQALPAGPTGLKVRTHEWLWSMGSRVQNLSILGRYLRHWPYFLVHSALRKAVFALCSTLARLEGTRADAQRPAAPSGELVS
jgi:hypothetical protein